MKKKIQLTGLVKEDNVTVEYETRKHDSISSAEADLVDMMDTCLSTTTVKNIELVKTIYNFVECYKDEYSTYKYSQDEMI
tara:strand:- start:231 stop:470 length:240 start_codon:yes stop_codon:yes gene_type:complete